MPPLAASATLASTATPSTRPRPPSAGETGDLEEERQELDTARRERNAWLADHPEAARRLRTLDRELNPLPEVIRDLGHTQAAGIRRDAGVQPPSHGIELDFGP